ncbi:MAG: glycosyltransferase involved in cell wall biosynthesis [Akkermansiaceae bacterium]|jgi:glycosyltransferase involved in cell wall biosynthesis|nr:glycosyl transferase family GT2 [uncultured bacterium]MDB4127523.1 glycosyltransferase [bacterium]|tara:strand:- start:1440 stop:2339 length:900 start_codon:yes stop_codon:yes gene_type:complete
MKSEKIDFSIITPSLNYGKFIGECLESVDIQHDVVLEHLIYDAGSTDETDEIVSRYPKVRLIQEPDDGMSHAINKGFAAAKGKWVMWLNADDRLKPGALKAVLEFAAGKSADVIYSGWDFVNETGSLQRSMTLFPFQKTMHCYLVCYIGSTAAFYRKRTVIDEGHLLNENFKYVMDGEFYNRLASVGKKFSYLHSKLADFRVHGGNLSLRHRNKRDRNASDELVRQKQFAESATIIRCYGQQVMHSPPWVWFADGILSIFFRLNKFVFKRVYRWCIPLVKLEATSAQKIRGKEGDESSN